MTEIKIIKVTPGNADQYGICCVKNKKSTGYKAKIEWMQEEANKSLTIQLAVDETGNRVGFIN